MSCSSTKDRLLQAKSFEYNGDEKRLKSNWIMPNNLFERILRLMTPIIDCGVALFIKKNKETFNYDRIFLKTLKILKYSHLVSHQLMHYYSLY